MQQRRKKKSTARAEVPSGVWLPEAYRFGSLLGSSNVRYAIFGAGALAVHNVMVRPTVDIDFVVDNYGKAIALLNEQPGISEKDLAKDKDGIQVGDFHFQTGVTVQVWDNNLYSLPMNDESWSRVAARPVPGYGLIRAIGTEDLIVSKVGRYTQQRSDSRYEADKNVNDIVSTMATLLRPDVKYAIKRLKEGARREQSSNASRVHSLDWYFVREVDVYREAAGNLGLGERIQPFVSEILSKAKTRPIEHWLLHNLRKTGSLKAFQASFMLDEKSVSPLLERWGVTLQVDGDKAATSSRAIQDYIGTLEPETSSEYAKKLAYSGKEQEHAK